MAAKSRTSNGNGSGRTATAQRPSPEPKLAPLGKEIQRFGTLRGLPIALAADARRRAAGS